MCLDDDRSGESFLRARWLEWAGVEASPWPDPQCASSLEELRETEWSPRFEALMRNRLVIGALRYGRLHAPGKPKYDRVASMIRRLQEYDRTHNKELLVDVANLCLLDYEEGDGEFAAMDEREHVAHHT